MAAIAGLRNTFTSVIDESESLILIFKGIIMV
jgi:hypothetical protein